MCDRRNNLNLSSGHIQSPHDHMNNKKVQEKLCTETKEPGQALELAIAFEEGVNRQKAFGAQAPD